MKCNYDCFNCVYEDCVNDESPSWEEYKQLKYIDSELIQNGLCGRINMSRYIRNRPDKELYVKARNKEYEKKRGYPLKRREMKRRYYERNKDTILEARKEYYEQNRDIIRSRTKNYYELHKDEINRKRREKRALKKGIILNESIIN